MSAIVEAIVTVVGSWLSGPKRYSVVKITFGNGIDTYPANGVSLPSKSESFGLISRFDNLLVEDEDNAQGYLSKYDKTNNKIRLYEQGLRTGSTIAADSVSGALAEGGTTGVAETAVRLMGSAIDTTYQLGQLRELTTTSVPAAITIKAIAIGY